MASERDIANRLPEPPAPSPEARDAAVAEALVRFDRLHPTTARDSGARPLGQASAVPPWRMRLATPAVRYLAAASVMIFVAAPAAWFSFTEIQRRDDPQFASSPAKDRVAPIPPQTDAPARSVGDRGAVPAAPPPAPAPQSAPAQPPARQDDRSAGALGYSEPRPAPPPSAAPAERSDAPAVAKAAPPPPPAESRARRESSVPLAAPSAAPAPMPPRSAAPQPLARQQAPSAAANGGQDRSEGDWGACRAGEPDRMIIGCTGIIEDQARSTADRRTALLERGQALARRGEVDRAIADFTEVIRQDPASALAFYNRSLAYRAKGELDRADADLARALGLGLRGVQPLYRGPQGSP